MQRLSCIVNVNTQDFEFFFFLLLNPRWYIQIKLHCHVNCWFYVYNWSIYITTHSTSLTIWVEMDGTASKFLWNHFPNKILIANDSIRKRKIEINNREKQKLLNYFLRTGFAMHRFLNKLILLIQPYNVIRWFFPKKKIIWHNDDNSEFIKANSEYVVKLGIR